MKQRTVLLLLTLVAPAVAGPAVADDVTGKSKLLCTTVQATECFADGACIPGPPENWNLPRFTKVDFDQMTLTTTEASGENRSTSIERIESEGDDIFAQGAEDGRAFSIVLDQDAGTASVAIAFDGSVLAAFAVCTPLASTQ